MASGVPPARLLYLALLAKFRGLSHPVPGLGPHSRRVGGLLQGLLVDSGANDFKALSNTFFFDKCLGWDGLCVEPNPAYPRESPAHRSCTLVPEIIAARPGFYDFGFGGVMGSVRGAASETRTARQKTAANPLDVMLRAREPDVAVRGLLVAGRRGLRNDGPGGHRLREDPRRLDPRRGLLDRTARIDRLDAASSSSGRCRSTDLGQPEAVADLGRRLGSPRTTGRREHTIEF